MVPDAAERDVFVCGPPGMMRVIDTALHAIGIPPHRIHDERFSF
jgi:ferredoxin-NADP reductase